MVSWLPHIVLPTLVALAFFRMMPRKWVLVMAPIAWVPDLDYFSPGEHRVLTHNIWIPLALAALSYLTWRAKKGGTDFWSSLRRPGWPLGYALAAYYWGSHVFLDVFAGGVLLFWPVLNTNFYLFYEIYANLQTGEVEQAAEAGTSEGAPEVSSDYTWFSFEHTAALAFLALVGLVGLVVWLRRRRKPA